jgi:purine catabolism regulator
MKRSGLLCDDLIMAESGSVMLVEDLVSTASLGIEVLAGGGGLGREVLWAHSCEMQAPEQWLGPHELLMTVGLCVPANPDEQRGFIRRLDDAGLAGLMIGDHDVAPPVSEAMLTEAERRDFPLLLAATETPYAVVSRHVAAATSSSQILQVLKLSKLYQVAANADDDFAGLMAGLGALLRADLRVVDSATGITVLETGRAQQGARASARRVRSYPLRGRHAAELILVEYPGEPVESFILVHLMKVLEVTIDRVLGAADARAQRSAQALAGLLAGTPPDEAERILGDSLAGGYQVAAFAESAERIARGVALRELPVLVGAGRTSHLALIPLSQVAQIRELAEASEARFGVSSVFIDHRDVRSAAEEAARVLTAAQFSGRAWTEFEGTTIAVLSRSNREAEEIIGGVLGPLAEGSDGARKLRESLFAYLRHDRHWQRAADELGIHRQTLSYRLNRIEQETGLSVTRSADIAAFWVAYQAWESVRAAEG